MRRYSGLGDPVARDAVERPDRAVSLGETERSARRRDHAADRTDRYARRAAGTRTVAVASPHLGDGRDAFAWRTVIVVPQSARICAAGALPQLRRKDEG